MTILKISFSKQIYLFGEVLVLPELAHDVSYFDMVLSPPKLNTDGHNLQQNPPFGWFKGLGGQKFNATEGKAGNISFCSNFYGERVLCTI